MGKLLRSKTNKLYYICQIENGQLLVSTDGINSIDRPGAFIKSCGGIKAIVERLKDEKEITYDEFIEFKKQREEELRESLQKRERDKKRLDLKYEKEYNELLENSNGVIPTTFENIKIVLRYLYSHRTADMPEMTIGYSYILYNCRGHEVGAIKLDEPIYYRHRNSNYASKFKIAQDFKRYSEYLPKYRSLLVY